MFDVFSAPMLGTVSPPVNLSRIPTQDSLAGVAVAALDVSAYFSDADPITYSAELTDTSPLPTWLDFTGSTFSGTPEAGDVGVLSIRVTADDGSGGISTADFVWIVANVAAFTTTTSGNSNAGATWVGGVAPTSKFHTWTNASHNLTIPVGVEHNCGGLSQTGGSLTINGTLHAYGNITDSAGVAWNGGPGGKLSLHGTIAGGAVANVTRVAASPIAFIGTSGNRFEIDGTAAVAEESLYPVMNHSGNGSRADLQYVNIRSMGRCVLGRSHGAAAITGSIYCRAENVSIVGCVGSVVLDELNALAGRGFKVGPIDVRDCGNVASSVYQPEVYFSQAASGAPRTLEASTFDNSTGTTGPGYIWMRGTEVVFEDNVIVDWNIQDISEGTYQNCVMWPNKDSNGRAFFGGFKVGLIEDSYIYDETGGHPLDIPQGSTLTLRRCVLDGSNSGVGLNWIVAGSGDQSITVEDCIIVGKGNLIVFVSNSSPTLLTIRRNTFNVDNDGATGSGLAFAPVMLTEQSATNVGGTIEIYNNYHHVQNDVLVDLLTNTADQVDYCDYNVGRTADPTYGTNVDVTAGLGSNDFNVDALASDTTRNLLTWGASLGLTAPTARDVFDEMLKKNSYGGSFNSNFTVQNLLTYVRAGYAPTGAGLTALTGTGRSGGNIGAGI